MPDVSLLAAFCVATLTLTLSPGPSNLYIMACTLNRGARAGIAAASGMAIGSVIYVLLTCAGLATVMVYSEWLFRLVKLTGAAYLIFLGLKTLNQSRAPALRCNEEQVRTNVLRQSLFVELTNPKTALFFLAFLPQFVTPHGASVSVQLLTLGIIYTLLAFASDMLVVGLCRQLSAQLNRSAHFAVWQDRIAGMVLLGLGAAIIVMDVAG